MTNIKIDEPRGADLRARIDKSKGLTRKERQELVDLLRKNMLYQTPKPVFEGDASQPTFVDMRFVFGQQQRILELIVKACGWTLPPEEQEKILLRHEEMSRRAIGDGIDYDLSHLDYGALVSMHGELKGIEELAPFRKAIGEELKRWGESV